MPAELAIATNSVPNIDEPTVAGFGDEWAAFDQRSLDQAEWSTLFDNYFAIFPFKRLPPDAEGFDLGCGSGRWAIGMAPRVGRLHCIDPSAKALEVARRGLSSATNVSFHLADGNTMPLLDASQDFGYSLGVLHHVPDPVAALQRCVEKLRSGAPFLLYLYYAMDDRPGWFRALWRMSDGLRRVISRLPFPLRKAVTDVIAALIYWPLARAARLADEVGINVYAWPLGFYRRCSFYTMRTDALDRFGTRLEQRFTRHRLERMMADCGLTDIRFLDGEPYWVACGTKA